MKFDRIIALIRIVRPPNLLLVAMTMFLVRHYLIVPIFRITCNINTNMKLLSLLRLGRLDVALLILSAVCICAAGNVINDCFDQDTDRINKPSKQIVGKHLSISSAMSFYWALNITGIAISAYLSFQHNIKIILFIHLFTAAALYFYSWKLKKQMLIGNILVSLLTALIPLLPALAEPEYYVNFSFVIVFAIFAFLSTLSREIIKDIQDMPGDESTGSKTLPIVTGVRIAKWMAVIPLALLMMFIFMILSKNFYHNSVIPFRIMISVGLIPLALVMAGMVLAKTTRHYQFLSYSLKGIMAAGILCVIPFYYFFLTA